MINENENLILINGQNKTLEIESCVYQQNTDMYLVTFKKGSKAYTYKSDRLHWMRNPEKLDVQNYQIRLKGNNCLCTNLSLLLMFSNGSKKYYYAQYTNGTKVYYEQDELIIVESCFNDAKSQTIFNYFKDVADANTLKNEEGTNLLSLQYRNVDFLSKELAIASYLYPEKNRIKHYKPKNLIYPLGCNTSQLLAVQRAFENQISIIQGPPGTGKTQTILNIIANILMLGKSVLVVSNNNSAIQNISEKLAKYELDFLVASLGRSENKQKFIETQVNGRCYPQTIKGWRRKEADKREFVESIRQKVEEIKHILAKQERLAVCRQELSALELEWNHFKEKLGEKEIRTKANISSRLILKLLNEFLELQEMPTLNWWAKMKWWFKKQIYHHIHKLDDGFLQASSNKTGIRIQALFYISRIKEMSIEIEELEKNLSNANASVLLKELSEKSMEVLKNHLHKKYAGNHTPYVVTKYSLKFEAEKVLEEFPVVLSTTFSARSSLCNVTYDYLIMDEASQVAVETGVLALSCAKNAIIVGDTMQLPNVVTTETKERLNGIFEHYDINQGYDCSSRSFLQSVLDIIPTVSQTLLREHYRCAPRIINFCNQKFYGGELVIMTEGQEIPDEICAIRTVKGNHSREHINQREIDVINEEVMPNLTCELDEVGIIAPYNKQVDAISQTMSEKVDVATVHKFQGREKDVIIMSIVDDQITTFADDPNLLNVAVSRAKKKFCLVVTGNAQEKQGNICDLLDYIEYNNGTISDSRIYSVFDLLYKQYADARIEYLKRHKRISEYDSENLVYILISDILKDEPSFGHISVICHYPLNILIRDYSMLTDEEQKYVSHNATHLDFLIYNCVSKRPVLAIEVDGWSHHQQGSKQFERDKLKNHILSVCGIDFLRLSTTGSGERIRIVNKLEQILNSST